MALKKVRIYDTLKTSGRSDRQLLLHTSILVQWLRKFPGAIHTKFPPQPGNKDEAVPLHFLLFIITEI